VKTKIITFDRLFIISTLLELALLISAPAQSHDAIACSQLFQIHRNGNFESHERYGDQNTLSHLNSVVTGLAQLTVDINAAIADGQLDRAAVLRADLKRKYLEAEGRGIDLSPYLALLQQISKSANEAIHTRNESHSEQKKSRLRAKEAERELLPWTTIRVIDSEDGGFNSASFSPDHSAYPDHSIIATASNDRTAKIWSPITGDLILTLKGHTSWVRSARFSPDGSRIVTASDDQTAKIWNPITGILILTLKGHSHWLSSASYSQDGYRIVTASRDSTAKIWNATTGELITTLIGHMDWVHTAAFSPDGSRIVTASNDRTAKIWNAITGELITTLRGHTNRLNSTAFSPDGSRIATASDDGTAKIWNAITGELITTLTGANNKAINSAVFSPKGSRILTASDDKTAKIWNALTGDLIATLTGHAHWVSSAVFNHDASQVLTTSGDGTTKVWTQIDLETPTQL
jgi:WD40 repeat protein